MDTLQAVVFGVIAVVGFVGGQDVDAWLFDWANGLTTLTLGVLILLFLPVMPFTEQYARESVPKEYWEEPDVQARQPEPHPGVGCRDRGHGPEQPCRGLASV